MHKKAQEEFDHQIAETVTTVIMALAAAGGVIWFLAWLAN